MSEVKYLIFDIETVGDGDLIQKVRYPDQELTPREATEQYRRQLLEETGKDILPGTFVLPVSVAIAKVAADLRLMELTVLDAPANGAPLETNGASVAAAPQEKMPGEVTLMDLVALAYQFPINPDAPRDGAAQHDHYLYGMPKNLENEVE